MRKIAQSMAASIVLAGLAACMSPPTGLDVSLDHLSKQGRYEVAVQPVAGPAPLNRMHAWSIQLRSPSGTPVNGAHISIDGGMPQHGHGFPTQPRVTRELGDGRYLVEGMKFSMPGWWQIKVKVDGSAGQDEAAFNTIVDGRPTLVAGR
jgi:hypothetical protein